MIEKTPKTFTADYARSHFKELLDAAEYNSQVVTITRFGEAVAQIVPMPKESA